MSDESVHPNAEAERVIARLRPHGRVLVLPTLIMIATVAVASYFVGNLAEEWQNNGLLIGAVAVVVLFWLLPLLAWLSRRYVVTSRRIVVRHGLFVRTRQELLHSRGYDVRVRRHALQSLFRTGTIELRTGPDRPLVLRDIPRPGLVQAALHDLIEKNQQHLAPRWRQTGGRANDDETTAWGQR
jgi:membrane protein YdbS with pleckstrin-like domain